MWTPVLHIECRRRRVKDEPVSRQAITRAVERLRFGTVTAAGGEPQKPVDGEFPGGTFTRLVDSPGRTIFLDTGKGYPEGIA